MIAAEKGRAGSTLDAFLAEEGVLEEATERAIKGVLAWQIDLEMKARNLTKAATARRMRTSRAQLDQLLDPDNSSVTLHTLHRAAAILGKRLRVELVQLAGQCSSAAGRKSGFRLCPCSAIEKHRQLDRLHILYVSEHSC